MLILKVKIEVHVGDFGDEDLIGETYKRNGDYMVKI